MCHPMLLNLSQAVRHLVLSTTTAAQSLFTLLAVLRLPPTTTQYFCDLLNHGTRWLWPSQLLLTTVAQLP